MGANYRGYNPVTGDDIWTIAGEQQVASGGALNVESGGVLEIKSGGSLLGEAGAVVNFGQGGTVAVAGFGVKVDHIWTYATAGAFKNIQSELEYAPVQGGYGTPIAVVGKTSLGAAAEFTGSQGAFYGVQGQINFKNGATLNQASSIFAALRGVITSEGTPVFTAADTVAGLYCDNLCAVDLRGVGVDNGSAFASFQNHGGGIDHLIHVHGSGLSPITNLFSIRGVPGFVSSGTAAGAAAKMQMLWGADTYYINIYQA